MSVHTDDPLISADDPAEDDAEILAELARITPSHEELMRIAATSVPPPELVGIEEEKPW
jgi:hypothetical protein